MNHFPHRIIRWTALVGIVAGCQLAALPANSAQRFTTRTNINPALLYWQAFSLLPELTEAERKLGIGEVPMTHPTEGEKKLATRFDDSFRLLVRATRMTVPCDWGLDLADGPNTVIPSLVKIRHTYYACVLRARVALAEGREAEAREEILAVLTMARQAAREGSLVQVMIAVAIEESLIQFIASHYNVWSLDSLRRLDAGFEAAPPRVTTAEAMDTERMAIHGWMLAQLEEVHRTFPGDEARGLAEGLALLQSMFASDAEQEARLTRTSGGTLTGLIAAFRQAGGIYPLIESMALASPANYEERRETFQRALETNDLARLFVPNIVRARATELRLASRSAMLKAAIAYKADGPAGLKTVPDPFGQGAFTWRQKKLEDGTSGFELESALALPDLQTALFFSESNPPEKR